MFHIAICEDDGASRSYEEELVRSWARDHQYKVTVDAYCSAEQFLFEAEDRQEYDLLVLDIQMGDMNGMELAAKLRAGGTRAAILFLTGVPDYALEGYEVGAVRYLLKPLKEEEFLELLDVLFEKAMQARRQFYLFEQGAHVCRIPLSDILYLEARGHYVCMHTVSEELEWKAVFSAATEELAGEKFFLLKRGLLVNLEHVEKITRTDCLLDQGDVLPVSRERYRELNKAFIAYYRGVAGQGGAGGGYG